MNSLCGIDIMIDFYDGTVQLEFDEDTHSYYLIREDGKREIQDGVTTVCGIIDKSNFLIPWACNVMEQKLLKRMPREGDNTASIPFKDFTKLLKDAKKRHQEIFEGARDVGLEAHAWIENSIKWAIEHTDGRVLDMHEKTPTDERSMNCGLAAFQWMTSHNVQWLKTERKVYSKKYKYAGTMDGLAKISSCGNPTCCDRMYADELSLIDWKSSNALRTEYLYQTAAYLQAETEEFGCDIKSRWILRLGKKDGKFQAWYTTDFETDFKAFLLCLFLRRIHRQIDSKIRDMKES